MKKFTIQSIFLGINIGVGLASILIVTGSVKLFGINSLGWSQILLLGGVFTLLFSIAHQGFLAFGILPSVERLKQIANLFHGERPSSTLPTIHTREFYELAQMLESNTSYFRELAQTSHDVLQKGGRQTVTPRSEADVVGKAFQEQINTMNALEEYIREITKGNLVVEIPKELNETTPLKVFRVMTLEIRQSISKIRHEVNNIANVSEKVAAMSQQGSRNAEMETQAIESIASSIHQMAENLRGVMQNINLQTTSLDETFTAIAEMLSSVEEINSIIHSLSSASDEMSRSVDEIHGFMQEIEGHAQSSVEISGNVSDQAKEGFHAVAAVSEGIQTIKTTVQDAATAIQRLGKESGRIGEILEVINGVAEQTNLLALNASIIAAQAGEHGRGFSVVASEIKELADRTRVSTKEIADIIRSVQAEVAQGMDVIQSCLVAVDEGVELANQSGEVLKKIVQGIQASRKMVSTMASATVTQTENSQQLKAAAQEVTTNLAELQSTAKSQADRSTQLAEVTNFLKNVTQQIDQSAVEQLQATDAIVHSIEQIQKFINSSSRMMYILTQASKELRLFENSLVERIGRFFVSPRRFPRNFDQNLPTIAFVGQGSFSFSEQMSQGFQHALSTEKFQSIILDSRTNTMIQAEHINWLLQQSWLKGIVITPVDEHITSRLVSDVKKQKIPIVAVDASAENADVCVVSDNTKGGEYVADGLREKLPEDSFVLMCGSRNINSVNNRMNGFLKKAESYCWNVIEIFGSVSDLELAKINILEGLQSVSEAKGLFLTTKIIVLAYLDLLREGKISERPLYVAGFDITSEIAEAVADGRLLFTVAQDPVQLGSVATQELLALLQQPSAERSGKAKEVLIPVKKVTKEDLS